MKKVFRANSVWDIQAQKVKNSGSKLLKVVFFLVWVGLIVFFSISMVEGFKTTFDNIKLWTIGLVSRTIWTEMKRDENWNVNMLLLWYGGGGHDGWFLTDSIIVASRNPEIWNVSMFSIPRDLEVKYPTGWNGRINAAFYLLLKKYKDDYAQALSWEMAFIWNMLGLEIPYYATIDFTAFKEIVDVIGGIDVVVPETIHDTTYPNDANRGYITFHLDAGDQHLDGATALKYARSRHSTSDFSRSLRQQQILKGIKDKMLNSGFNASTVWSLYDTYMNYVKTNVDVQEMLWTTQFLNNLNGFSSFGFTTNCGFQDVKKMIPACFLYYPSRELFGWASVMLPMNATVNKLDYYTEMQNFTKFITSQAKMVQDKTSIEVVSAIDPQIAKEKWFWKAKFADQMAVKIKRYGFNAISTMVWAEASPKSTVVVNNLGDYTATLEALKVFVPDFEVYYNTGNVQSWWDENGNPITFVNGADIQLVLWNDYLLWSAVMSGLVEKKFSYEL